MLKDQELVLTKVPNYSDEVAAVVDSHPGNAKHIYFELLLFEEERRGREGWRSAPSHHENE
jgi:hypothetical protein